MSNLGNDMITLEEIEEEISLLCAKRTEILYSLGFEERYFIYNNRDLEIANDAWALSSRSETDKKILHKISEGGYYDKEWNDKIKSWLEEQEVSNTDLTSVEDI